ncbi:tetratricopeptide repeat protein [Roseicyclus sp.]
MRKSVKQFASAPRKRKKRLSCSFDNSKSFGAELETFDTLLIAVEKYIKDEPLTVLALCDRFIDRNPANAEAYKIKGDILMRLQKAVSAVSCYVKAISIRADFVDAYVSLAKCLIFIGKDQDAIKYMRHACHLSGDTPSVSLILGEMYREIGLTSEAKKVFLKILSNDATVLAAHLALGDIFKLEGSYNEALAVYQTALRHYPDSALLHFQTATTYNKLGALENAIKFYRRCIELGQEGAAPHYELGVAYTIREEFARAQKCFEVAIELEPDNDQILASYCFNNAMLCDWSEADMLSRIQSRRQHERHLIDPFTALVLFDDVALRRKCAEDYVKVMFGHISERKFVAKPAISAQRLRVGYFSGDLRRHPVSLLMARTLEEHDRSRFEIFGYGLRKPSEDDIGDRVVRSFCEFFDISKWSNSDVYRHLEEAELDVAVDLSGHTLGGRMAIFARRVAPVQINYLGFPGTSGGKFIDYIVADRNLIPKSSEGFFSEKIIFLPDQYQAQDVLDAYRLPDVSRLELGLPASGFVFCAFNNSYKITQREFDIWIRLVESVEGSVLWLYEKNMYVAENLRKEAALRGLDPSRIIFLKKMSYEKYLSALKHANLFLDTFNYNAGATASDALRVGLPVLTMRGNGYTARMASSLLLAVGLPDLITDDESSYEAVALKLALDQAFYVSIREKLERHRLTMPLFDTERFTRNLERAYMSAFERFSNGGRPDHIYV